MSTITTVDLGVPAAGPRRGEHGWWPAWLGLRITFGGVLTLSVIVLVMLAALNSEANLLLLLCGISLGVVAVNVIAPVLAVRCVEVERTLPISVIAGRPFEAVYVIRNRRLWGPAWALTINESGLRGAGGRFGQGFVPRLRRREEQRVKVTGVCPRRGRVTLSRIAVSSRFPFGLFACEVRLTARDELIVYPSVGRLRKDPWRVDPRGSAAMLRRRKQDA